MATHVAFKGMMLILTVDERLSKMQTDLLEQEFSTDAIELISVDYVFGKTLIKIVMACSWDLFPLTAERALQRVQLALNR